MKNLEQNKKLKEDKVQKQSKKHNSKKEDVKMQDVGGDKINKDSGMVENVSENEKLNNTTANETMKENINENLEESSQNIKEKEISEINYKVDEKVKLTKKQEFINFLKFLFFSVSAGIIQTLAFTLFNELCHFSYWPSYLIALILSVVYNFTINRKFTFKSANNIPKAMLLVLAYYAVFTPLSTWWGAALTKIGWNEYIVLFGTMVINMVTEFLWWRYVIFNKSINTAKTKDKTKK